ncbi:hypothetical protein ABKV19_026743 [Rosa sericea]
MRFVLPAILFVKASNAELWENIGLRSLLTLTSATNLKKKKMKALIPQVTQIIYFGGLSMLCVGPMMLCSSSIDIFGIVSIQFSV